VTCDDRPVRICVMYDCLFPWTVGGAERWYRELAERLAAEGHEVTYLTLRQWDPGDEPQLPGVKIVSVGGKRKALYGPDGNRKIGPPIVFGAGAFWHLLRHARRYDVVHTASFPFFSLLAAALVLPIARFRISCDWHEVWSAAYWREYLGPVGGRIGWLVQWLCAQVPQTAYSFSELHAGRLRGLAKRRKVTVLTGEYGGDLTPPLPTPAPAAPQIVYAGRWIPEKRVAELLPALALVREAQPELRVTLLGAGPERERVLAELERTGQTAYVDAPGFVSAEQVDGTFAAASVVVQPSSREGYGMVVVESAARGIPVVVVRADDNASTELVDAGRNGFVAESIEPRAVADALLAAIDGGPELREATCAWFAENAERLSIGGSLAVVSAGYAQPGS
jgi:glycosyltransferase involved in cell wall biosynthesis